MDQQYDIPVVMIVYKRLDLTKRSFAPIRELQPKELYIISDGPRSAEEEEKVQAVRSYIEEHIDWPCHVHKNYAKKNMWLRYRMPSGMQWVFETADKAVFVEDDIDTSRNFFEFCRDMLNHYESDDRVLMVTGSNIYAGDDSFGIGDITFSAFASIWGWATWKRAWEQYDVNIHSWREIRKTGQLKKILHKNVYDYYKILYDDLQYHWYRTWDHQWTYLMHIGKGVGIVPKYNLINNIGMGSAEGEHPADSQERVDFVSSVLRGEIKLPIHYPEKVARNAAYDDMYQQRTYTVKTGFLKKVKYGIRAWYYGKVHEMIREMENDTEYLEQCLPGKYKMSEVEQVYNKGDKIRLVTPREMRRCVREYQRYRKSTSK